jgi:hypothetical protein
VEQYFPSMMSHATMTTWGNQNNYQTEKTDKKRGVRGAVPGRLQKEFKQMGGLALTFKSLRQNIRKYLPNGLGRTE